MYSLPVATIYHDCCIVPFLGVGVGVSTPPPTFVKHLGVHVYLHGPFPLRASSAFPKNSTSLLQTQTTVTNVGKFSIEALLLSNLLPVRVRIKKMKVSNRVIIILKSLAFGVHFKTRTTDSAWSSAPKFPAVRFPFYLRVWGVGPCGGRSQGAARQGTNAAGNHLCECGLPTPVAVERPP